MAMKLYNDSDIQDIADAIRSVNGENTTYKVSEMAAVISTFVKGKRGNLRDYFGYYDNKRLRTSGGVLADETGSMVVDYIDLSEFVDSNNQIIIRTKGVDFWQNRNDTWRDSTYVFYDSSQVFGPRGYITDGTSTLVDTCTFTRVFDANSDEATFTISNLTATALETVHYLRMSGWGSGANLDIRINETFD